MDRAFVKVGESGAIEAGCRAGACRHCGLAGRALARGQVQSTPRRGSLASGGTGSIPRLRSTVTWRRSGSKSRRRMPVRPGRAGRGGSYSRDQRQSAPARADRKRVGVLRRPARVAANPRRGGPIDVVTGDYLAEFTMLILCKTKQTDPESGYARIFPTQFRQVVSTRTERGT